ncbi:DJ-1/PfpI family protein [Acidovorax sp. FJL06]|uniref:DJ-1/PfpI family protein n=1 Tax=Acidovorax sp. FJL06 TaxID=2153365 RepID=UPI000F5882E7|nr:DJ-1/PfpI family protein [Acidovorax sp. FJL06]
MAVLWRWMVALAVGGMAVAVLAVQPAETGQDRPEDAPLALALRPALAAGAVPVIAVLALNEGTETTDFLVPHAVLRQAGVGRVEAVAPRAGPVVLMPALQVEVARSFAAFDAAYPEGADIVVVPALHTDDDPLVLAWLRAQATKGAVVVGICAGARVLGQAGLLDGRRFTGHWYDRSTLLRRHAGAVHVPGRRYVADGPIVTTTGGSASLPVSLAIVEALAGAGRARVVAAELGLPSWGDAHRSGLFGLGAAHLWTLSVNTVLFWRHERVDIPVAELGDDVALAWAADAWSRTYRSRAQAVHAGASSVQLRSGLVLRTVPPDAAAVPVLLDAAVRPACVLDHSLRAIGQRYGAATRRWVATQLEYDDEGPAGACPDAQGGLL